MGKQEWSVKLNAKFRHEDWTLMTKIISVLKVFFEATEKLSHSSACISEVIPAVTVILHALDRGENDFGITGCKFNMRSKLRHMMGHFEETEEVYMLATLLDPRYKDTFFIDPNNAEIAKGKLIQKIENEVDIDAEPVSLEERASSSLELAHEEGSVMEQIAKKIRLDKEQRDKAVPTITPKSVVEKFLSEPLEKVRCLRYYKEYEDKANNCKVKKAFLQVAKRFLTPPATSTNVE